MLEPENIQAPRYTRKVALISGANRGLGKETARRLGRLGMTVLIGARNPAQAEATAQELRATGIDA